MKSNKPIFVLLYGFPASGKTTFGKNLSEAMDNTVLISADGVRKELYGSEDKYGDGNLIYLTLLDKIKKNLRQGKNVIYDGCNLYKSYRLDFLREVEGLAFWKVVYRINTPKEQCIQNHNIRGRNFSLDNIMYYFDINEPPRMEEGWDEIIDYSWMEWKKKIYLASPFFGEKERYNALKVSEMLRLQGHEVHVPLEHKIPNAWDLPNYVWGRKVFNMDVENIKYSNVMICLSYGRVSSAGTNWEAGYAFGMDIPVIVVEMEDVNLMSLMLMNGSHAVLKGIDSLAEYDFEEMPRMMDYEMEQK